MEVKKDRVVHVLLISMLFLESIQALQELNEMIMTFELVFPTLENYLKKVAFKLTCSKMFIAPLFVIAHNWKQPKCSTIRSDETNFGTLIW